MPTGLAALARDESRTRKRESFESEMLCIPVAESRPRGGKCDFGLSFRQNRHDTPISFSVPAWGLGRSYPPTRCAPNCSRSRCQYRRGKTVQMLPNKIWLHLRSYRDAY